mgnify:CR=1 FL=1
MNMNRRNVLVGLGALVGTGGVAVGSGAFTQTTAGRTVTTEINGDQTGDVRFTNPDGTYATVADNDSDGMNEFELTFNNLNDDAVFEYDGLFDITLRSGLNPGDTDAIADRYEIYVANDAADVPSGVTIPSGIGTALDVVDSNNGTLVGSGSSTNIKYDNNTSGEWDNISDIGVTIDTSHADPVPGSIPFVVESNPTNP